MISSVVRHSGPKVDWKKLISVFANTNTRISILFFFLCEWYKTCSSIILWWNKLVCLPCTTWFSLIYCKKFVRGFENTNTSISIWFFFESEWYKTFFSIIVWPIKLVRLPWATYFSLIHCKKFVRGFENTNTSISIWFFFESEWYKTFFSKILWPNKLVHSPQATSFSLIYCKKFVRGFENTNTRISISFFSRSVWYKTCSPIILWWNKLVHLPCATYFSLIYCKKFVIGFENTNTSISIWFFFRSKWYKTFFSIN